MSNDGTCDLDSGPNEVLWELSINYMLSLLLMLIIVSMLVVLNFSKTATFNKLTLWPYYLLLVYTILA